jgi:hypothetical protein
VSSAKTLVVAEQDKLPVDMSVDISHSPVNNVSSSKV